MPEMHTTQWTVKNGCACWEEKNPPRLAVLLSKPSDCARGKQPENITAQ